MEILKKFNSFIIKESDRIKDDDKVLKYFENMKKDFKENDEDLRKVSIFGYDNHSFVYVTEKFSEFKFNNKVEHTKYGIKTITDIGNYKHRIFIKETYKHVGIKMKMNKDGLYAITPTAANDFNINKEIYDISEKIYKNILDYFLYKYDVKYPQLRGSSFKSFKQIKEIESGIEPTLGYINIITKDRKMFVMPFKKYDDKNKYIEYAKNNHFIVGETLDGKNMFFPVEFEEKEKTYNELDPYGEDDWNDNIDLEIKEKEIKKYIKTKTREELIDILIKKMR